MYKIKQSVINKRKRGPYFVALYVVALAAVFSFPALGEDFDWIGFSFIFGLTSVVAVGANLAGSKRFITYALNHEIIISTEGLKIIDPDSYCVLPWNNVTHVKQRLKSGHVSRLSIYTANGCIDLTNYEQLDKLALGLKSFIDPSLWK